MHDPLKQLIVDHVNVAKLLDMLRYQADVAMHQGHFDPQLIQKIFRYLTQYQDLFHHPKEDLIFNALIETEPSVSEEVRALEQEHKILYALGADIFAQLSKKQTAEPDVATPTILKYTDLLERHMKRESNQVFPLAEIVLRPKQWTDVETELTTRKDPLFGPQVEAAYQGILGSLTKNALHQQ